MSAITDLLTLEAAAIIAAFSALGVGLAKVWPLLRRLARFLDDVQGEPARPGVPARPGWGERLTAIETRLTRVEATSTRVLAQTENSHSTNLRDDLDAVAAKVGDLHAHHVPPRKD